MKKERSAKVISFYNYKGGTGKTMLSVNLAAWLAKDPSKRVLFLDMDAQCNADIGYLGFDMEELEGDPSKYKSILNIPGISIPEQGVDIPALPAKDLICRAPYFGLYAIKGSFAQDDYWENDNNLKGRLDIILDAIDNLRSMFDYIIIDLGPRDNLPTLNALTASDYVVIAMSCESQAINGAQRFFKRILPACQTINPMVTCLGIVANRYKQSSYNIYSVDMQYLADTYKTHLFNFKIRECAGLLNLTNWDFIEKAKTKRPVCFYDRYIEKNFGAAYQDIMGFIMELLITIDKSADMKWLEKI